MGAEEAAAPPAAAAATAAEEEAGEEGKKRTGWRVRAAVLLYVVALTAFWLGLHWHMRHAALSRAEEGLVCMCEERARMLQDQFAVSVNHVHALAILVATFNYEKQPPALDQVRPQPRPPPSPISMWVCNCVCTAASSDSYCFPSQSVPLLLRYSWFRAPILCGLDCFRPYALLACSAPVVNRLSSQPIQFLTACLFHPLR
jgi:hypothetical protein